MDERPLDAIETDIAQRWRKDPSLREWEKMAETVKTAVETWRPLTLNQIEGESKFVLQALKTCVRRDPVLRREGVYHDYHMYLCHLNIERPSVYDPSLQQYRALYPNEAKLMGMHYVSRVKLGVVFQVVSKDGLVSRVLDPIDQLIAESQNVLPSTIRRVDKRATVAEFATMDNELDAETIDTCPPLTDGHVVEAGVAFVVNAGEVFVQRNGEFCNLTTSGGFYNNEGTDEGNCHIVNGEQKASDGQFTTRPCYATVRFAGPPLSPTHVGNMDTTAPMHHPILVGCDIRPVEEDTSRATAACHLFLTAIAPALARKDIETRMRESPYDSEAFHPSSCLYNPLRTTNTTTGMPIRGYHGFGESCNLSFPNIQQGNFTLLQIMFLLGIDSRHDMIKTIIPEEYNVLKTSGVLAESTDEQGAVTGVLCDPSDERCNDPYVRQAYLVYNAVHALLGNQGIFAPAMCPDVSVYHTPSDSRYHEWYQTVAESMPFVGYTDAEPTFVSAVAGRTPEMSWFKPPNYDANYRAVTLDGWDRAAVLAHTCVMMADPKRKSWSDMDAGDGAADDDSDAEDKDTAANVAPSGKSRAHGAPRTTTFAGKMQDQLKRFTKSFVEEFLPHLGKSAHWRVTSTKIVALGSIVKKMVMVYLGYARADIVDSMRIKRVDLVGLRMAGVYRASFFDGVQRLLAEIASRIEKRTATSMAHTNNRARFREDMIRINVIAAAASLIKPSPFAGPFVRGAWSKGGNTAMDTKGTTRRTININQTAADEGNRCISHLMRGSGAVRLTDKPAQNVHESAVNIICPSKTANDNRAGLTVALSKCARVRLGYNQEKVLAVVLRGSRQTGAFYNHLHLQHTAPCYGSALSIPPNTVEVRVHNVPVGYTYQPYEFLRATKEARHGGLLPYDVSITWIGGSIGSVRSSPLTCPMLNFINVGGDPGSIHAPYLDMKHIWKLPAMLAKFSTAAGIYPNLGLFKTALKYADMVAHPKDVGSFVSLPPCPGVASSPGVLAEMLLKEGVICYRDTEELDCEYVCGSMRDFAPHAEFYMEKSYGEYLDGWDRDYGSPQDVAANHVCMSDVVRASLAVPMYTRNHDGLDVHGRRPVSHATTGFAWTLVAISEEMILSVTASQNAFANCNAPIRTSYATGWMAQSLSHLPVNYKYRKDLPPLSVIQPMSSLSLTSISRLMSMLATATAARSIRVTFKSSKFNGEDAVEQQGSSFGRHHIRNTFQFNCSALDVASAARSMQYDGPVKLKPESLPVNSHAYGLPPANPCLTLKSSDYRALDDNGMPKLGCAIPPSGAVIGRLLSTGNGKHFIDGTKSNQTRRTVHVDEVMTVTSGSGSAVDVTVKASSVSAPQAGDKYADHNGQKGIGGNNVTPFDAMVTLDRYMRGCPAEIVRGPPGVVGRATASNYMEMAHGYTCLSRMQPMVVSPWGKDYNSSERMIEYAKANFGDHVMVNSRTGRPLLTTVSVGFLDYKTLIQLAASTLNSRGLGPVDPKTHQPTEGNKKGGGSMMGRMELDNVNSQGASDSLVQMIHTASDPSFSHLCQTCGMHADVAPPAFMGQFLDATDVAMDHARAIGDTKTSKRLSRHRQAMDMAQNGPNVVSAAKSWVLSQMNTSLAEREIRGRMILPSGGYCMSCKRSSSVYSMPVPRIVPILIEGIQTWQQTWRHVTDVQQCQGELAMNTAPEMAPFAIECSPTVQYTPIPSL